MDLVEVLFLSFQTLLFAVQAACEVLLVFHAFHVLRHLRTMPTHTAQDN